MRFTNMTFRLVLCCLLLSSLACNKPEAKPEPTREAQPAAEAMPSDELGITDDENEEELELANDIPEEAEPKSEKELDQLGKSELEAACFRGSTAACDRLGH